MLRNIHGCFICGAQETSLRGYPRLQGLAHQSQGKELQVFRSSEDDIEGVFICMYSVHILTYVCMYVCTYVRRGIGWGGRGGSVEEVVSFSPDPCLSPSHLKNGGEHVSGLHETIKEGGMDVMVNREGGYGGEEGRWRWIWWGGGYGGEEGSGGGYGGEVGMVVRRGVEVDMVGRWVWW